MNDTPSISNSNRTNATIDLSSPPWAGGWTSGGQAQGVNAVQHWGNFQGPQAALADPGLTRQAERALFRSIKRFDPNEDLLSSLINQPKENTMATRRIVQVFIADPDINAPLEQSVLYEGKQKLTDLNDMELYFEVPMVEILATYNEKRRTWLDKDATKKAGKDIFLDPVKIRDLKMVVVTVAQF